MGRSGGQTPRTVADEENGTSRHLSPHERLYWQIQNHPFHFHQDLEEFAMAAEEHSAFRHRLDLPVDDLASVGLIRPIWLNLPDRRAAVSTCLRRSKNLSSPCNPAGRLGPSLSHVPHQFDSGEVGLYSPEMNCQNSLQKGFRRAFLVPPRIYAVSLRDS